MYKNYYSEINVSANVYKLHFSAISLEFGCSFRYLEIQNTVIEQQLLLHVSSRRPQLLGALRRLPHLASRSYATGRKVRVISTRNRLTLLMPAALTDVDIDSGSDSRPLITTCCHEIPEDLPGTTNSPVSRIFWPYRPANCFFQQIFG